MQHNKVGEPKLFRLFGRFSVTLFFVSSVLCAGNFEDFKKSQSESFQKYKDERDTAFNQYLKEQWKGYNAYKGTPLYEEPKPKSIPFAKPIEIQSVGPEIKIELKTEPEQKPIEEEISKEIKKDINFRFYGTSLGFDIPPKLKEAKFSPQNQQGITNFFDTAASSEHEKLVSEINRVRSSMHLNDWGVYLLVLNISEQVFSGKNESRLLSWFLFNKLGYAVKVGLSKQNIVLMHYSNKIIYSTPTYTFSNKKFYVVEDYNKAKIGKVYSYEQNYPGSEKPLNLSLEQLPLLHKNMKTKTLSFKEYGKTYDVTYTYNKNLIDFMATYPQADYETFFNAPIEDASYYAVSSSLKKYIDGKKASDAMNFVLHFVQKSFQYEIDEKQFGREKVMFAEETLYFDKSDCEDRAVLFAYLVKELFFVGVVGVKYKDHMATALYLPMHGDSIQAGNKKFILADPTYIDASIGQSMPKYRPVRPESFIIVRKDETK